MLPWPGQGGEGAQGGVGGNLRLGLFSSRRDGGNVS